MLLLRLTTENLAEGLVYTALGFAVVMIVLLLITFVLYLFSAVVNGIDKKSLKSVEEKKEAPEAEIQVVQAPVLQKESVSENEALDTELIAVITAAVAASINTTSDRLVVRSIRKVNSWKKESIRQKNNGLF